MLRFCAVFTKSCIAQ